MDSQDPILPPLDSNELVGLKGALGALQSVATRHEGQYRTLQALASLKEQAHSESKMKAVVHELLYKALQEQHAILKMRMPRLCLAPHPMCYGMDGDGESGNPLKHMMVTDCAFCSRPFPFYDIVVAHCRHLYHPWCAMSHFRQHQTCAHADCPATMSYEWQKSFGFKEVDI